MGNDDIHIWVRIFLLVFVLVGLLPHFHKSLSRIADYLSNLRRSHRPGVNASAMDQDTISAPQARMGDIEHLIFTRLAQTGTKGMSPNAIAEALYMDRSMIRRPLQRLHQRGFIRVAPGLLFGRRLALSEKGRALAVSEGLIPRVSHKDLY